MSAQTEQNTLPQEIQNFIEAGQDQPPRVFKIDISNTQTLYLVQGAVKTPQASPPTQVTVDLMTLDDPRDFVGGAAQVSIQNLYINDVHGNSGATGYQATPTTVAVSGSTVQLTVEAGYWPFMDFEAAYSFSYMAFVYAESGGA